MREYVSGLVCRAHSRHRDLCALSSRSCQRHFPISSLPTRDLLERTSRSAHNHFPLPVPGTVPLPRRKEQSKRLEGIAKLTGSLREENAKDREWSAKRTRTRTRTRCDVQQESKTVKRGSECWEMVAVRLPSNFLPPPPSQEVIKETYFHNLRLPFIISNNCKV